MLRNGREVLVTAKYLRPGRNRPVNRVNIMMRDALYRRRAEANHAALISTVAHELRSPLTSVKGFSSTLLRRWDRFTDDQKRLMIETIEADADRVTRLITELLDVSRIDAGRLQIRPQPIDVPAVFEAHVARAVASGHDVERFRVDIADAAARGLGRPRPARPDPVQPRRERPASRRGHRHAGGRPGQRRDPAALVVPGARRAGRRPRWSATRASGIDPSQRELIFSRFWHGSSRGSTGLGLYVVKGLVEAHGGQVVVETAPSGGAQFRLSLPSDPPSYLA